MFGGSFFGEVRWHSTRNSSCMCSRHPLSSTARLMITIVIMAACDCACALPMLVYVRQSSQSCLLSTNRPRQVDTVCMYVCKYVNQLLTQKHIHPDKLNNTEKNTHNLHMILLSMVHSTYIHTCDNLRESRNRIVSPALCPSLLKVLQSEVSAKEAGGPRKLCRQVQVSLPTAACQVRPPFKDTCTQPQRQIEVRERDSIACHIDNQKHFASAINTTHTTTTTTMDTTNTTNTKSTITTITTTIYSNYHNNHHLYNEQPPPSIIYNK